MSIETVTTFFGWCTVINFGLLLMSTVAIVMFRASVAKIHSRMFDLEEKSLARLYFQYLGNYKIVTLALSLVPYLALKLMQATESLPPI